MDERTGNTVVTGIVIFLLVMSALIAILARSFGLFVFLAAFFGGCVLLGVAVDRRERRQRAERAAAERAWEQRRRAHLAKLSPEDRQAYLLQEILEEQRASTARREQLLRLGAAAFIWNQIHK